MTYYASRRPLTLRTRPQGNFIFECQHITHYDVYVLLLGYAHTDVITSFLVEHI